MRANVVTAGKCQLNRALYVRWVGNMCGLRPWVAFGKKISHSDAAATLCQQDNTTFRPLFVTSTHRDSPDKTSEWPGTASLTASGCKHSAPAPMVPAQPAFGHAPALRPLHGSPRA